VATACEPGAAKRREPDFGFVLRREVSDEKMFRIVSSPSTPPPVPDSPQWDEPY
jgi:hypothetical protein